MQERRAAEVAQKNRDYEARGERVEAAARYVREVPKEQRVRAAIEQLATGIARQRGLSGDAARQLVAAAVRQGDQRRGR